MLRGLVACLLVAGMMLGTVYDYLGEDMISQTGCGSIKVYDDGDLPGLWTPNIIVVHWGGWTEEVDSHLEDDTLRGWQRYHLRKGWRDIAYNYAIGETGNMYRLRGENPSGATSGRDSEGVRWNQRAVNIVWIGGKMDLDGPSPLALARLDAYARERGLPVIGHVETGKATQCPGQDWLDHIHNMDIGDDEYMRIGDEGVDVEKFQNYLNRFNRVFGDPDMVIKEDGIYGEATEANVNSFQEWANLQVGDASVLTQATLTALVVPNVGVVS